MRITLVRLVLALSCLFFGFALAQICAIPGNDGSTSLSGIVNSYWRPSANNATYDSSSSSISLINRQGASIDISSGDLVLVIQMQCATIDYSDSNAYGDGISEAGDGSASGYSDPSGSCLAGQYEFVRAGPSSGASSLDLSVSALQNTYVQADATNTAGRRTLQIIRVPQYWNATLTGTLTAAPWNGYSGGVVVLDVANDLDMNAQTINVDGLGFRGGGGRTRSSSDTTTRYRWDDDTRHASKGEGIAGTPRYVGNKSSVSDGNAATITDNGASWGGYPTGSSSTGDFARGAPANAGGGGTYWSGSSDNGGGAGGGNGGEGGRGGAGWRSGGYGSIASDYSDHPEKKWGFGGSTFSASLDRLVLGGGGGAGDNNNNSSATQSSGANGGGIIMLRANTLTGSGTLYARGARASDNPLNDGAGGGGAGGSIVALANTWTAGSINMDVSGGRGGDAWPTGTSAHGTGGGGGGGVIFRSGAASATLAGGSPGSTTTSDIPSGDPAHGATTGNAGSDTLVTPSSDSAGNNTAYNCLYDYGDAPASYGDASHAVTETASVYLGSTAADQETESQYSIAADADGSDEDAFISLTAFNTTDTSYSLNVDCAGSATVAGWIDYDGDGFEATERATASCSAGTATLTWNTGSGNFPTSLTAQNSYVRLRIASTASELTNASSVATDGEVEDYTITISQNYQCPVGYSYESFSGTASSIELDQGVNRESNALGALSTAGSTASNSNSAILGNNDILTLDLEDLVPEGSSLTISIARNNNNGEVTIETSPNNSDWYGAVSFNNDTGGTDTVDQLNHLSYSVINGSGGVRYVRFTRTSGSIYVDGVSYSERCVSGSEADLSIEKTVDTTLGAIVTDADSSGNVTQGDTITFNITVTNNGPDSASSITVTDTLPAGYSYVSSSISGGNSQSVVGSTLSWGITSLANGASVGLSFDAVVETGGTPSDYENTASLSSATTDTDSSNDSDSVTPDILKIIKYVCNESSQLDSSCDLADFAASSSAKPGDVLVYRITFQSFSTTITAFDFTDDVPDFTTLIENSFGLGEAFIECHASAAQSSVELDLGAVSSLTIAITNASVCNGNILPTESGAVLFKARVQ